MISISLLISAIPIIVAIWIIRIATIAVSIWVPPFIRIPWWSMSTVITITSFSRILNMKSKSMSNISMIVLVAPWMRAGPRSWRRATIRARRRARRRTRRRTIALIVSTCRPAPWAARSFIWTVSIDNVIWARSGELVEVSLPHLWSFRRRFGSTWLSRHIVWKRSVRRLTVETRRLDRLAVRLCRQSRVRERWGRSDHRRNRRRFDVRSSWGWRGRRLRREHPRLRAVVGSELRAFDHDPSFLQQDKLAQDDQIVDLRVGILRISLAINGLPRGLR